MSYSNYLSTTRVPVSQTVREISELITSLGATEIVQINKPGVSKNPVALRFTVEIAGQAYTIQLPARIDPVFKALQAEYVRESSRLKNAEDNRAAAEKIAWRLVLALLKAQTALVESGMSPIGEVFLAYMVGKDGQTVFQSFESSMRMLPSGRDGTAD